MTAGQLAALLAAVAAVVLATAGVIALYSATRALLAASRALLELRDELVPLVTELGGTAKYARADLERLEGVLGSAESVSETMDATARLVHLAVSNPLIKVVAFSTGVARAGERLRGRRSGQRRGSIRDARR
ncbi:MAG: hypothetical protein ACYDH5_07570 [Acidimicrobiales bacterium]